MNDTVSMPRQRCDLGREFDRIRRRLLEDGRLQNEHGAFCRAMLNLAPAFANHIEHEAHVGITPKHLLDGTTNALANLIHHLILATVPQEYRIKALENLLRHWDNGIRPKYTKSEGGIILPNGGVSTQ